MRTAVLVLTWKSQYTPPAEGIIGIFDDELTANQLYDALEAHGDKDKTYFLDKYELNEIKKEKS